MSTKNLKLSLKEASNDWDIARDWARRDMKDIAAEEDPRVAEVIRGIRNLDVRFVLALMKAKGNKKEEVLDKWLAATQALQAATIPAHLAEEAEKNLRARAKNDAQAHALLVLGGRVAALTGSRVRFLEVTGEDGSTESIKEAVTRLVILAAKKGLDLDESAVSPLIESEIFTSDEAAAIWESATAKPAEGGEGQ